MAHGVNLDALSAQQLTALINDAEAARRGKVEDAKRELRERMLAEAAQIGVDPATLFGAAAAAPVTRTRRRRSDAGKDVPAKYRSPNGETWSGRGRMPRWLHAAEASGRKRSEFAV